MEDLELKFKNHGGRGKRRQILNEFHPQKWMRSPRERVCIEKQRGPGPTLGFSSLFVGLVKGEEPAKNMRSCCERV